MQPRTLIFFQGSGRQRDTLDRCAGNHRCRVDLLKEGAIFSDFHNQAEGIAEVKDFSITLPCLRRGDFAIVFTYRRQIYSKKHPVIA
jgi:hypothetical protein